MISLYKLEHNLRMLGVSYDWIINDDDLQVYVLETRKEGKHTRINIDVKEKFCMIRTEKEDKEYKSTKGIINELWRVYRG